MFKRLLVPLDGSSLAETVLPLARYLSERLGATLILFHVVEKDAPNAIHGQHHLRGVDEAKTYLAHLAAQLVAGGMLVEQHVHEVQQSGVAQMISDHAAELHADLIILCAHGHGGLRAMLFGSIAERVIRHGTLPVLFIRPEHATDPTTHPIRKILLPLDGSKSHEVAIRVADGLTRKLDATLLLLNVVPTSGTVAVKGAITGRVSPRTLALSLDISAQQAEEYLAQIAQSLAVGKQPVVTSVLRGDVAPTLIEAINAESVDLVVMTTHGHGVLDARWDGSLTPSFLPKSPVPVLLVRGVGDDVE